MKFNTKFSKKIKNSNLILVAIFIVACKCSFAFPFIKSRIERANEALNMYDYFRAKKLFYKSIHKNYVDANYGLAVIFSRTDNPFSNIDSALLHIQNSRVALQKITCKYKKNTSVNNADGLGFENEIINKTECLFKSKYILVSESLFNRIDSILFTKALQNNSVDSYQKYLKYYSTNLQYKGSHYYNAKQLIGNILFEEALQQNKSIALIELSKKCDSTFCIFNSDIKNKIPQVILDLQFTEMAANRNIQAYNIFRKEHPKSIYEVAIDDSIFELSTQIKTETKYYDFIKANPQNRNIFKAWQLIYNSASNDNSPNFFKHFLERYPEYPYIENVAKEYKLSQTVFYKVKRNKLFGFCDITGTELVKPAYDFVDEFSEGFCVASLNGKSGFIGRNGNVSIPFIYDEAESFRNGLAVVKKESKYLIITKKNETLFSSDDEISDYSEGLAVAKKNDKFGYLNEKCTWKIEPEFDNAYDFKNGFAVVEKNGKVGLISKEGNVVVNFEYEWIDNYYGRIYRLQTDEKVRLLNTDNGKVILEDADFIDVLSEGLAAFYKDEKVGYIDSIGNILILPQFEVNEEAKLKQQFNNGFATVIYKGKNVIIDKTGKRLLPTNYQAMKHPSENLIAVKKKNKWGYVDLHNDVKIKLQYQEATVFTDGLAIVKLKSKNMLIDNKGNIKLKLRKQTFHFLGNQLLVLENANHKNLCDNNLNIIVSEIDEIKSYKDNLLQIDKMGKMAYYDYKGKKIIWQEDGFTSN